jgi:hypothetical protein
LARTGLPAISPPDNRSGKLLFSGHHHHYHGAAFSQDSSQNPNNQLFADPGQALPSGNFSDGQRAYTTLQQDFISARLSPI